VQVSYHHANPKGGNESILLRFQATGADSTTTVLIDSGARLDLDALLNADETVDAICLTHAHTDHYQSLAQSRGVETSVYASPATKAILGDVFDVATKYEVTASDAVVSAVQAIDGWTTIGPAVECHPMPAGHAPGAVGYLFRFDTETAEPGHILVTGDFTLDRAGGYPGFPVEGIQDVDALFLTAATNGTFTDEVSEGLGIALQQAHSGMQTLVTASGLFGVHVAYLLDALITRLDLSVQVRVVGQVAKLYRELEYECDNVDLVPVFEHTDECLAHGTITIAGPEIPTEKSSGRLFGVLREQPAACVVQLIGSGEEPRQDGQCAIHAFDAVNHPSRETLETVNDTITPRHTIIVHRHRGAGSGFNEFESYVWSPSDAAEYDLYAGGEWLVPPWGEKRHSAMEAGESSVGSLIGGDILEELSLPDLERYDDPDIAAEGIDVERVERIVTQEAAYTGLRSASNAETGGSEDVSGEPNIEAPDSETMASDNTNGTDGTTPGETARETQLIETTGLKSVSEWSLDDVDDELIAAVESGDVSGDEVETLLEVAEHLDAPPANNMDTGEEPTVESHGEEAVDETEPERTTTEDSAVQGEEDDDSDEIDKTDLDGSESVSEGHPESTTDTEESKSGEDAAETTPATTTTDQTQGFTVQLDSLTTALAASVVEGDAVIADISTVATNATTEYLAEHLRGADSKETTPTVELSASAELEQTIENIIQETDRFDDVSAFTTAAIGDALADVVDLDADIEAPEIAIHTDPVLIDAVGENDSAVFDSRGAIVSAAVQWYVETEK
jgi:putative mRNA 3-end processing factor